MVREREAKLLRNELAVEDYTLKNAVILLEKLYQCGGDICILQAVPMRRM
jgi:hypothetical protein